MFEYILLGAVQGIAEWLPVSSEGIITLLKLHFFPTDSLFDVVRDALFLHLGTALAAIVYFHKDIFALTFDLFHFHDASHRQKRTIIFLVISTLVSGVLGLLLLTLIPEESLTEQTARTFTALIGVLLLITGGLQLYNKGRSGNKSAADITLKDSAVLGLAQGCAALPGLSRSGLTVAALLLLGYAKQESLRLSFLMSIPIVLLGNVILNADSMTSFDPHALIGLVSAFVFGLLTIDLLLRVARKIEFGYFVLFFAILTLLAAFI
jgi:undecaprenyl-diphosphatase